MDRKYYNKQNLVEGRVVVLQRKQGVENKALLTISPFNDLEPPETAQI